MVDGWMDVTRMDKRMDAAWEAQRGGGQRKSGKAPKMEDQLVIQSLPDLAAH